VCAFVVFLGTEERSGHPTPPSFCSGTEWVGSTDHIIMGSDW
jgi:hypothetical protein